MKLFLNFILISYIFFISNISNALETSAKQAILIDSNSKQVLFAKNENEKISPASLTKIMTAAVVFELIKKGEIKLDDKFIISTKAWRMSKQGYSSMFIMPNDKITVENLLKGIIVASGNDACIALAEGVAGTESNFATLMNDMAKRIGMDNTHFSNSSGIYDQENYSTVADIAKLSIYLIDQFPELYKMFKEKTFEWSRTGGSPIKQANRNSLLYKDSNVDGIKTGHLSDSGYSLAASMKVGDRRVVSVLSGTNSNAERTKESSKLLNYAIITNDLIKISKDNQNFEAEIWNGKINKVKLSLNEDIFITYPKRKSNNISLILEIDSPIKNTFKKGDQLGNLKIQDNSGLIKEVPVYANEDFKKINFISRFLNTLSFLVWG